MTGTSKSIRNLALVGILASVIGIGGFAATKGVTIVSRLAYAVETGKALAARDQLAHATNLSEAFQHIAKGMRPSVVNVSSVRRVRPAVRTPSQPMPGWPEEFQRFFGDDFFDRFFEFRMPEHGYEQRGLGSGVIVSDDGYILTNHHVIRGADEVTVKLSDERTLRTEVVGTDEKTDLAVLKVEASGLVPAELGDSDAIEVGQWVLAIGNPFSLEQTVTAGIVSAKGRADVGIADYEDFIQTDAAINPGNSGGPLVDLQGNVVGINTAIATRSGGYMGIGFAIPSNMARTIMESIIKEGKVERGQLGAFIQDLTLELSESFGFEGTGGVLVGDVVPDGPADKAGLRSGDIVVKFNGRSVTKAAQLRNAVAATTPGTEVELTLVRDGKRETLTVRIGRLDDQLARGEGRASSSELGIRVQELTPELATQLGYADDEKGVVVTEVEPGSLAQRAGIRPKDVIVAIGGNPIADVAQFRKALEKHDVRSGIRMQVESEGVRRFVFLKGTQ